MLDGFVYAVGGWEGRSRLDSVECYDPHTNSWQFKESVKMAVTSPAVVALDGLLYVTGSKHGMFYFEIGFQFILYFSQPLLCPARWSRPGGRRRHRPRSGVQPSDLCLGRGRTHADRPLRFGRLHAQGEDLCDRCDSEAAASTTTSSLGGKKEFNLSFVLPGGWHASTENTDKVECYSPKTNQWTMCAPMKERRYRPGAAVVDGKIYVLGGEEGWDR